MDIDVDLEEVEKTIIMEGRTKHGQDKLKRGNAYIRVRILKGG